MHSVVRNMMIASIWMRRHHPQPTDLFHNMWVTSGYAQVAIILSCCGEITLVTHKGGQK